MKEVADLEQYIKSEITDCKKEIEQANSVIKSTNNAIQIRTFLETINKSEAMIEAYNNVLKKLV